jgi:hypothetical protein
MGSPASAPGPDGRQVPPYPGQGETVPADVLRAWDQAEARLFPLVMARPDLYQQAVSLIQALLAVLRESCRDLPSLLAVHERGGALVSESGQQVPGVRPELVAAAACAMRYRELVTELAARQRLAALTAAREQGLDWAVVEETGDEARVPFVPYQRIEADPGSGLAVIVSIGPDETQSRAEHRLDEGELDLATGRLQVGDAIGSYSDAAEFGRALAEARARLGGLA